MHPIRLIRPVRMPLEVTWDTAGDLPMVQGSTPGPIPEGTIAIHSGPLIADRPPTEVVLVTPDGATTTGRCRLRRTGPGTCTFAWGTGWLAGFHASLRVTTSPAGVVSWAGTYYFGPAA